MFAGFERHRLEPTVDRRNQSGDMRGEHARVLQAAQQEAPAVLLKSFADNGIVLELDVWIRDPSEGQQNLRSDLNWELWRRFRDAGITMPYPQRMVHLVSDQPATETT